MSWETDQNCFRSTDVSFKRLQCERGSRAWDDGPTLYSCLHPCCCHHGRHNWTFCFQIYSSIFTFLAVCLWTIVISYIFSTIWPFRRHKANIFWKLITSTFYWPTQNPPNLTFYTGHCFFKCTLHIHVASNMIIRIIYQDNNSDQIWLSG